MEITEVKVFPIQEEKLKAFVSIVFDHCFMVNDIKIIQGRDGLFISMPSRKKKSGEFKDVAHPLNNETRRTIEDRVLGEYERVLAERGERVVSPTRPTLVPQAQVAAVTPTPNGPAAAVGAAAGGDGAASPTVEPAAAAAAVAPPEPERTLEEIEEMHLRDSFWTVT